MKRMTFFCISLFLTFILFANGDNLDEAELLIKNDKLEEAKSILEEILDDDKDNHKAHFLLGKVYFKQENFKNAIDHLEKAVGLDDSNSEYRVVLGASYANNINNVNIFSKALLARKAKKEFLKAIQLDPDNIETHKGICQFYAALPSFAGGDFTKALEEAEFVFNKDEHEGRLLYFFIYRRKGMYSEGEKELKIIEEKYGGDISKFYDFYNDYGYFLLDEKRYEEAIEKFKRQIELAPDQAISYDSLGDGYMAMKDYENALKAFKKALEVNPDFKSSKEKLEDLKAKTLLNK